MKFQFNRVGVAAIAVGVIALGGVSVAVTRTLKHQSHPVQKSQAAPVVAHNAPITRAGQAGTWTYRCIYAPNTLASGPSLCGMEQAIYVRVPKNKTPVRFGSVFVSHATQDPSKLALRNVPWFLSVMVPAGVDVKTPAQLILSKNEGIPMTWKSCDKNACTAESVLSKKQMTDLLSVREAGLRIVHQGSSPWTVNLNFAGSTLAINNLLQWSMEAPFK